jgi:hypothetical protein
MSNPKDSKDPKAGGFELEGLDWDNALAEWEEKTFLPEAARDRETQSPGALQGTPPPPPTATSSRPLYVPPSVTPAAARSASPPSPPSAPPGRETRSPLPTIPGGAEDEEAGATVVAAIPRELLRKGADQGGPRSAGGGLGQMFARSDRPPDPPPVDLDNAPTQTRALEQAPDDSLITSAKELELHALGRAVSDPHPLKRPPKREKVDSIPEGQMFDPFAEPDPFQGNAPAPAPLEASIGQGGENTPPAPFEPIGAPRQGSSIGTGTPASGVSASIAARDAEPPLDVTPGPPLHQPERRAFDPDTDTSTHLKGAIHSPSRREYDPNEETSILSKAAVRAQLGEPPDLDGDNPTQFRYRGPSPAPPKLSQSWEDERPAHERISEPMRVSFAARASWLEAEARTTDDRPARARALLAASELRALIGEGEAAEILAREAAATSPTLAMAPRQARALAPLPREALPLAEALDAEGRQSPTPVARLHDVLLAADVLRLAGEQQGAQKRWDQAARLAPADPRAPLSPGGGSARGGGDGAPRAPLRRGRAPDADRRGDRARAEDPRGGTLRRLDPRAFGQRRPPAGPRSARWWAVRRGRRRGRRGGSDPRA